LYFTTVVSRNNFLRTRVA